MTLIKFTDDQIVKRLRWAMMAVMLFSLFNTLSGQPKSFWHHPETAIRGDGLSIHNETNHTFEFFLGYGWQAYLPACAVYVATAFLIVSILPKTAALIAIFSLILGHYFGASNWLAVRWHFGVAGPSIYGIVLGAVVAFAAFPSAETIDPAIKRLRWMMVVMILSDLTVTLIGQPSSYWHHPETMHEANSVSRLFLGYGWWAYFLYDLVYAFGAFQLVSRLSRSIASVSVFAFILGHFNGVSCWFFYQWRMGMEAPVIYGTILGVVIVLMAFSRSRTTNEMPNQSPETTAVGAAVAIPAASRRWLSFCR
jgi:hypothetical protein